MGRGVAVGHGVGVGTCVDVGVRVSVGRMVLVARMGVDVAWVAVLVGVGEIDVEALQAPSSAKASMDVMKSDAPWRM